MADDYPDFETMDDMIMFAENEPLYNNLKSGVHDNDIIYPQDSPEGGPRKTLGFGHKFSPTEHSGGLQAHFDEKGMTLRGAKMLFDQDKVERGAMQAGRDIDKWFGPGTFKGLHPVAKEMATALAFNVGTLLPTPGKTGWPNFMRALVAGNLNEALNEMHLNPAGTPSAQNGIIRRNKIHRKYFEKKLKQIDEDAKQVRELVLSQLRFMGGQAPREGE